MGSELKQGKQEAAIPHRLVFFNDNQPSASRFYPFGSARLKSCLLKKQKKNILNSISIE